MLTVLDDKFAIPWLHPGGTVFEPVQAEITPGFRLSQPGPVIVGGRTPEIQPRAEHGRVAEHDKSPVGVEFGGAQAVPMVGHPRPEGPR